MTSEPPDPGRGRLFFTASITSGGLVLATDSVRTLLDLYVSTSSCIVLLAWEGGSQVIRGQHALLSCWGGTDGCRKHTTVYRCGGSKRRRRLPIAGRGRAVLAGQYTVHIRTWWYSEVQEECVLTRCRSRHYISGIGSLVQAPKGPQPMPGAPTTAAGVRSPYLLCTSKCTKVCTRGGRGR